MLQDQAQCILGDYVRNRYARQPTRFGRLLLAIPLLRMIRASTVETVSFVFQLFVYTKIICIIPLVFFKFFKNIIIFFQVFFRDTVGETSVIRLLHDMYNADRAASTN